MLPATTWARVRTTGVIRPMVGTCSWSALKSSRVRVCTEPLPCRTAPGRPKLPAETYTTFVPVLWIWASMEARAPELRAIMAITEATPMMTPRVVRADLILFLWRAFKAMRNVLRTSMLDLGFERR